jgi:glycyl-tRNA synthetase alpha chain
MNFQETILSLQSYWAKYGCVLQQPMDVEVGAGTFAPATFLRVLDEKDWKVVYVQPSRRPTDGRYGENPFRLHQHYQMQTIIQPAPDDIQSLYMDSLKHIGINLNEHDIRFVEDDWESPTLGAAGLGWQVWCDGLEITQFTYFQQVGGFELQVIPVELTYGLERISMVLQGKDNIFELEWAPGFTYGYVQHRAEKELSKYNFEIADTKMLFDNFNKFEEESKRCLAADLCWPAYEYTMKCSHVFNLLDARHAVSVSERTGYIARVRNLAKGCARVYKGLPAVEVRKAKEKKGKSGKAKQKAVKS